MHPHHALIYQAYAAFNRRDIGSVLALLDTNVAWPNGWEGGYVHGHEAVRDYWTRQWAEIDPIVSPLAFTDTTDGRVEVQVRQVVLDPAGALVAQGEVVHVYTFGEAGTVTEMQIRAVE